MSSWLPGVPRSLHLEVQSTVMLQESKSGLEFTVSGPGEQFLMKMGRPGEETAQMGRGRERAQVWARFWPWRVPLNQLCGMGVPSGCRCVLAAVPSSRQRWRGRGRADPFRGPSPWLLGGCRRPCAKGQDWGSVGPLTSDLWF